MQELLRFQLIDPDGLGAPADDWARVLGAMQKLVHGMVLGAQPTLRPNAEFKRRHELRASGVGPDGAIALTLGPRQLAFDLQLGTSPVEVQVRLAALFSAIAQGSLSELEGLYPEPSLRRRVLREAQKLLPKGAERWALAVAVGDRSPFRLEPAQARWLDAHMATLAPSGPIMMTVTGELVGVDFDRGTYSVRYAPTGRILDGRYSPEEEVALLKSRRKLVHVTGEFVLDENDHPLRLKRATKVAVADLSPVVVAEVRLGDGQAFALVPPLSLVPVMDAESQQLYEVAEEALDLHVSAPTREQLESELHQAAALLAAAPSKAWRRRLKPLIAAAD
jgi:hypothetical protein